MKSKVFLIAIAMMIFGVSNAEAQNRQGRNFGNCPYGYYTNPEDCPNQELLQELGVERNAFDKQLTPADKTRLAEIRTQLHSLQSQNWQQRQQMFDNNSNYTPTLAERQQIRVNRTKIQNLRLQADEIADNYFDAIVNILDNYRPSAVTGYGYGYGGRGYRGQGCGGNRMNGQGYGCGNRMNGQGYGSGNRMNGQGYGRGAGAGMRGICPFSPTGYLLWDTSQPWPQAAVDAADNTSINLFPNPATDNVQVFFDVENSEKILISITDRTGNPVWSGKELQADKGQFTHNISLKDFRPGVYFVRIDTGSDQWVRRLVVR
ncbi:MAG TPA: T9SS type A sorting domain-containing protein [Bacteroidales bacterium]|nr:T9SS type A sorting domain-containing protein [Bacteroidales bacterium]